MRLSVVVTIVDGGAALSRCLAALANQETPPPLEVIIPYDDSVAGIPAIAQRFTAFTFLDLKTLHTSEPKTGPAGQHELYDQRRAAGLGAAQGDLVAIVEDRGVPRANWAATAVKLHARLPYPAIGGAIENGRDRILNWAVYFCDFGRYQTPFAPGARDYVSDVNVCYKRAAIVQTGPLWRTRYHEPLVHRALVDAGGVLFLAPELVVDEIRDDLHLGALIQERVAWGRLFATLRVADISGWRRAVLAVLSPLLPALLFVRLARDRAVRRRSRSRFIAASPLVLVLLCAWCLGEAVGYWSPRFGSIARPSSAA
jgi:glycosyl transferase family 2